MAHIVVAGGTSLVGAYLLPLLAAQGYTVDAISRSCEAGALAGICWRCASLDPDEFARLDLGHGFIYVHLAPLWLLTPMIPVLKQRGVSRIIAFSSTSVVSKQGSAHPSERALVARLAQAEQALIDSGFDGWTIVRPTLIYAAGADKNVALIASFIRRLGVFALIGAAKGLRQPVHAQDLARAVVAILESRQTLQRVYCLSGGETLSYRAMVERIFHALHRTPRIVSVPVPLFAAMLAVARCLPRFRHLHMQMAYRMNHDLCFDHDQASQDFGYAPRKFDRPLE